MKGPSKLTPLGKRPHLPASERLSEFGRYSGGRRGSKKTKIENNHVRITSEEAFTGREED